jgi:hypothetical protein
VAGPDRGAHALAGDPVDEVWLRTIYGASVIAEG